MSGRLVGIIVPGVDNAAEKGQLYKQSHQLLLKDWLFRVNVAIEGLLEECLCIRVEILHSACLLKFGSSQFGPNIGQFVAKGSSR
jgi:hypothetical protein